MQFSRRSPAPRFLNYRYYFSILREDFMKHCAYCTSHECETGGQDNFEIDHHRPKYKFPELENSYSNLYYCCHACNKKGAKGDNWPSDELIENGFRFFDPVIENAYQIHMKEKQDGFLEEQTNTGKYSIEKLRLNRDFLVSLRLRRKKMREILLKELKKLGHAIECFQKSGNRLIPEKIERLQLVKKSLENFPVLGILPVWW